VVKVVKEAQPLGFAAPGCLGPSRRPGDNYNDGYDDGLLKVEPGICGCGVPLIRVWPVLTPSSFPGAPGSGSGHLPFSEFSFARRQKISNTLPVPTVVSI
jgi:hypothetical protein